MLGTCLGSSFCPKSRFSRRWCHPICTPGPITCKKGITSQHWELEVQIFLFLLLLLLFYFSIVLNSHLCKKKNPKNHGFWVLYLGAIGVHPASIRRDLYLALHGYASRVGLHIFSYTPTPYRSKSKSSSKESCSHWRRPDRCVLGCPLCWQWLRCPIVWI